MKKPNRPSNKVRVYPCATGTVFGFPDGTQAIVAGFAPVGRGWKVYHFDPKDPDGEVTDTPWSEFKAYGKEVQ